MRIGKVLSYATARKLRSGDNPARIRGHFEFLARPIVPEVENHPAMQIKDVPSFMRDVIANGSTEARALAFLILTGPRSDELRLARRKEIEGTVWTIPAERMKAKPKDRRPHSVPLSTRAIKLLGKRGAPEGFIFPGRRYGARKPMWHSAMRDVLANWHGDRLSIEGKPPVPHGFRSTFRDRAAEAGYPRDLAERAIAHKVNKKTENAYQRSKLIEQRRPMMVARSKVRDEQGVAAETAKPPRVPKSVADHHRLWGNGGRRRLPARWYGAGPEDYSRPGRRIAPVVPRLSLAPVSARS